MRKRRQIEEFSISFLDTISCGFGAMIIMLVLTKVGEPVNLDRSVAQLTAYLAELQQTVTELRQESTTISREIIRKEDSLEGDHQKLSRLQGDLADLRSRQSTSADTSYLTNEIERKLAAAKQQLSEEMKRLLAEYKKDEKDHTIGGIPVDSEYVIFIIDTSGSMFSNAWPLVIKTVQDTLSVYPRLKGIQVINNSGLYMFSDYAGRWIPDTPSRRQSIARMLETWNATSDSSPEQGIRQAIATYYRPDRKISLFYMGDDYTGRSAQRLLDVVEKINRKDAKGNCMVRIHTIGFPVWFDPRAETHEPAFNFAILMRALSNRNCGTFIGLNSYQ